MKRAALTSLFVALLATAQSSFEDISRRAAEALDARPSEAAKLFTQALRLKPDWAEGWLYLGASLAQTQRYAEAAEAFKKGISLAPDNGTAWAFLSLCAYELNQPAEALQHIETADTLGIAPNPAFESEVRVRAAKLYLRNGAYDEALQQLQKIAPRATPSPDVLATAGLAAMRMNTPWDKLTTADQNFVRAAGRAAWEYAAQHPEQARRAFEELIAAHGARPGVRYMYGIYLAESDPLAALNEFTAEAKLAPTNGFAHAQIAFLQLKRGMPHQALEPARTAVKLLPAEALPRTVLGRTLLALDKPAAAIIELEAAAKLAPTRPEIPFFLQQAYKRAGRTADAAKARAHFYKLKSQQDPLSLPAGATQ